MNGISAPVRVTPVNRSSHGESARIMPVALALMVTGSASASVGSSKNNILHHLIK
ncbi:hypothetical protein ACFSQR_07990 [Pseudoduganella sp. GCM10020061]